MPVSQDYLNYVLEQLAGLPRVRFKRMFSGVGLYSDDVFFAIISRDALYFKVDDTTREDYVSRRMQPFQPMANRPDVSMSYYEVPADVLEDHEQLVCWARRAVAAGLAKARLPVRRPTPQRRTRTMPRIAKTQRPKSSRRKPVTKHK